MESDCISYNEIEFLPQLIQQYLNQPESLAAFYSNAPDLEGFAKQIEAKSFPQENRQRLAEVLLEQYGDKILDKERVSINALASENTYCVTTGHQLCTFTGPAYFIYKILSVIKLSRVLRNQFPDKNFVPIYWMATEDHDFQEINHFYSEGEKLAWNSPQEGDAVGNIKPELSEIQKQLEEVWKHGEYAQQLQEWFSKYSNQSNLGEATRYLVRELFSESGLLVVDANHLKLKELFSPYVQRDFKEQISFDSVTKTSTKLNEAGFAPQVNPREVNLFYLASNKRLRIDQTDHGFTTPEGKISWTIDELLEELEKFPDRFSPNVLLRPLYQEVILPNLAYIGGAGELSYWFQLKDMFNEFDVPFPILMLRNSVIALPYREQRRLSKTGFTLKDIFRDYHELEQELAQRFGDNNTTLESEREEFKSIFQNICNKAQKIDPTLTQSTEATEMKVLNELQKLEKKLIRGEKRNVSVYIEQLNKVYETVFPDGVFQERRMNFSDIYSKEGSAFFEHCLDHFNPLKPDITVIQYN